MVKVPRLIQARRWTETRACKGIFLSSEPNSHFRRVFSECFRKNTAQRGAASARHEAMLDLAQGACPIAKRGIL